MLVSVCVLPFTVCVWLVRKYAWFMYVRACICGVLAGVYLCVIVLHIEAPVLLVTDSMDI